VVVPHPIQWNEVKKTKVGSVVGLIKKKDYLNPPHGINF